MTRLRATIAKRLKEAQENGVTLTTFNEADMMLFYENEHKEELKISTK